jgi:hypothetical protein
MKQTVAPRRGDAESVRGRRPRSPVMDDSYKALSLSLSLGLQVSLLRDFGLWNRGLHDDVSIRKALRRLSARCATVVAEFIADSEARVPLATPTMQEVQDSES